MAEIILDTILGSARHAALAGGLTQLLSVHLHIGPDAPCSGADIEALLLDRWRGPLFDRCTVTWEIVPEGTISLASVEGVGVEHA
ncbi:MAG: hypothetical protein ACYTGJ_10195 [Planctomycetota bacterium]|jgi:hypothetical protein